MSRSRLSLRFAALPFVVLAAACHGSPPAEAPRSDVATTASEIRAFRAFPQHDARTALAVAARGLRSCGVAGRSEEIHAALRFDPNGTVGGVDVNASDAETTACVRKKLAEVAIAPFDGTPVTMRLRARL